MSLNSPPEVVPGGLQHPLAPVLQESDLDVASYETCMDNPFFLLRGHEIMTNPRVDQVSPTSGNVVQTQGSGAGGDEGEREVEDEGRQLIHTAPAGSEVVMETCSTNSRDDTKEMAEADDEIIAPPTQDEVDVDDPSLELVGPLDEAPPTGPPPGVQIAMMLLLHCLNSHQDPTEESIERESPSPSTAGSGTDGASRVAEERTLESVGLTDSVVGAQVGPGGEEHTVEGMDTGEQLPADTRQEEGVELMEGGGNGFPSPTPMSESVVDMDSQTKVDGELRYLEDGQVVEEKEVEVQGDEERAMEPDQQDESQGTDSQPALPHHSGEETDGVNSPQVTRERKEVPVICAEEEQSRKEGGKDEMEKREYTREKQDALERSNHGDVRKENDREVVDEEQKPEQAVAEESDEQIEIVDTPVDAPQDSRAGVTVAPPSGRVSEALPNRDTLGGVSNGDALEGVSSGGVVGGVSEEDNSLDSDLEAFVLTPQQAPPSNPPDQMDITAFHLLKWREELDGRVCDFLNDRKLEDLIRAANWYSPSQTAVAGNGEGPVTMAKAGERTSGVCGENQVYSFIPSWSRDLVASGKGKAPLDQPPRGQKILSKYSPLKLAPPAQHNGQPSQNTESDDALIYDSAGSEGPSPTPGVTLESYDSGSKSEEEQVVDVEESEGQALTDLSAGTDGEMREQEQRDQGGLMEGLPVPPAPRLPQKEAVLNSMEEMEELTCEERGPESPSGYTEGIRDEGPAAESIMACSPEMFSQTTEGSQMALLIQQIVSREKEQERGGVEVVGENEEDENQTEESFVDVTGDEVIPDTYEEGMAEQLQQSRAGNQLPLPVAVIRAYWSKCAMQQAHDPVSTKVLEDLELLDL